MGSKRRETYEEFAARRRAERAADEPGPPNDTRLIWEMTHLLRRCAVELRWLTEMAGSHENSTPATVLRDVRAFLMDTDA